MMGFSSEIMLFFGITAIKIAIAIGLLFLIIKIAKNQKAKRENYYAAKATLDEIEQELNSRKD